MHTHYRYIAERRPIEWKDLFKEATNIAFMVKYMFRESLQIAKDKFTESLGHKKWGSGETHDIMQRLVNDTLAAYGDTGIYDPERLAEIDFINQPKLLVELVSQSKHRQSRALKPDMQLLTEVTATRSMCMHMYMRPQAGHATAHRGDGHAQHVHAHVHAPSRRACNCSAEVTATRSMCMRMRMALMAEDK